MIDIYVNVLMEMLYKSTSIFFVTQKIPNVSVNRQPFLLVQVLWEKERRDMNSQKKQSFVDLGCGNGLLVYLLTSEGVQ